jgi:ligand-binding SRPBCC domain-containing protein
MATEADEIVLGAEGGLRTLRASVWLPRPVEEVFCFFADAHNLGILTPDFLRFEILTPGRIEMAVGTLIDYRIRAHGLPMKWRTRITAWDPPFRFEDVQLKGPYRRWEHTHEFEPRDGGTLCRDLVRYAVPGGALVRRWFVDPDLRKIFGFRQRKLIELFGPAPSPGIDPPANPRPAAAR